MVSHTLVLAPLSSMTAEGGYRGCFPVWDVELGAQAEMVTPQKWHSISKVPPKFEFFAGLILN